MKKVSINISEKENDGKGGKPGETEKLKGENKDGKGDGKKGETKDAGKQEKEIRSLQG